MKENERQKALIYPRVSSPGQKEEGHGLDSQEHRCRQYAAMKGYEVEKVFPDDASGFGDFMQRPGMVDLLAYLDNHPDTNYVVIFDDLKRFARDTEFHFKLRYELAMRGATVECLNFTFEDTPEGKFIETVFAAHGELERNQNARQVIQKMKARVEQGYYIFAPVLGYHYIELEGGGKMLAPLEPYASILREALEGFASGRFQSPTEVKRFLETFPAIPRDKHDEVRLQTAIDILRRPLYAGYITIEKWGLYLHPGKHEPLISFETWQKIQDRLNGNANAPVRKDLSKDFPLRGFVTCGCCGHPMTAAWSKGRNAQYAYYNCYQRGCPEYRKSFRKERIEGEFETLLKSLMPTRELFALARDVLVDLWQQRLGRVQNTAGELKAQIAQLERKGDQLMDRIMQTDDATLIGAYETQIKKMAEQKATITEKIQNCGKPLRSFDETFRTACAFLANPYNLWLSDQIEDQRMVLRLAYPGRIPYCRNEGFRTAIPALPFRYLAGIQSRKCGVVEPRGVEPLTSTMPL